MDNEPIKPAPKTLVIAGTYTPKENGVFYKVDLYGQTPSKPAVQYITSLEQLLPSYSQLEEVCREKFARYFKTDMFDIVSLSASLREMTEAKN